MILKYQKIIGDYTTYVLVEPDYADGDDRITELCTIGNDTYVYVPDAMVLPEQPFPVETTLEQVVLTEELKAEIKAISPHVRLINQRVVDKIREKYDENDELKIISLYFIDPTDARIQECSDYKAACREWGAARKAEIGL